MTTNSREHANPGFWSVVRTHAHKEAMALQALQAQGFTAFCPMTWKTVRRSRRLLDRKVPLFSGYIFIAFDEEIRPGRPINSTRGVQYLLADENGRPSRLPAEFVNEIQAHTSEEGIFDYRSSLSPGQQVRVRSGAFADIFGQVVDLDERGRARLLLELMSRQVRVSLPTELLQRVG